MVASGNSDLRFKAIQVSFNKISSAFVTSGSFFKTTQRYPHCQNVGNLRITVLILLTRIILSRFFSN